METNLSCCTRTGRTISEKIMEDGNFYNTKDEKTATALLANLYSERAAKLTTNGHDKRDESPKPSYDAYNHHKPVLPTVDDAKDDSLKKRINPLRIHLGKRPFVDNSPPYYSSVKKRKLLPSKPNNDNRPQANAFHRVPKLIPKRDRIQFHNVSSQVGSTTIDSEKDKPTPRLVPKSQLHQFKKGKVEKGAQLKEYAQSLGLQPMVKFKCRKCCSISFKTLAMLKEHQLVCRAQVKEPTMSPEAAPATESNPGGQSRVTRKLYLCSACGTYYENWNLFLHMREVHNRHICLFCLGMFSKAEKLASHLTNKHNVQEFNYDSKDEFFNVYNGTLYLMCCICDEICSEQDDFYNHDCNNVKPKPVPVLVSKKSNSAKMKNCNEISSNGPQTITKEAMKSHDKYAEMKHETVASQSQPVLPDSMDIEPAHSDASISSDSSAAREVTSSVDCVKEPNSFTRHPSPIHRSDFSPSSNRQQLPNGDESLEQSDDSNSPIPEESNQYSKYEILSKPEEASCTPVEKEGGIKLKLSLNKANSPVIINSTVDPTVGQQKANKPPSRVRRPPKRYEKEKVTQPAVQPKPPSIKMTICDKADNSFVKTTIYENDNETTKNVLNNNFETLPKIQQTEQKQENVIKTTIYDNKLEEDINTLNRVPKLTVRVPKELLDKDSSSDYSSDSDVSDKLTVDENSTVNVSESYKVDPVEQEIPVTNVPEPEQPAPFNSVTHDNGSAAEEAKPVVLEDKLEMKMEPNIENEEIDVMTETKTEEPEIPVTELALDRPLDKYPLKDLLKVFVASTAFNCIYCNYVRKIAVNCEQLALHMVAQHRFSATVDSITAEELMPETITAKLKTGAPELRSMFINLNSYDSEEKNENVQHDNIFECFQCYFKTAVHKDLYLHNRKMHQKTILLCVMCKSNFYSYSELLCHLCPGTYDSEYEVKFRCYLCSVDSIPSSFRLMVHLRKIHHTCDVCLEFCQSQVRLSNHVWKHKLHHLCYRCGIAYRNKRDITNHLFWKHGTESVLCKRCLQKKWPHVYHFCTPPAVFVCEDCSLQFTKAVYLKVHKRLHSNEFPHICTEEGCTEKFVSKKLLLKHVDNHRKKLICEDLSEEKQLPKDGSETSKAPIPVIDLIDDNPKQESGPSQEKADAGTEQLSKKAKKKKMKEKDALLLDVNLPALDLSESDSSDESDSGESKVKKEETINDIAADEKEEIIKDLKEDKPDIDRPLTPQAEEKTATVEDEKPDEKQVLEIWDNFKKYQAKVEKKEKTPPLVVIRKHVCESDHDYCLIPTDWNGDEDSFSLDKKKNKKSPKKRHGDLSSSSSSSSDSDSSCSCGSNCSCSSSSGSSSSSSSDSDSSDDSSNEKKKKKMKKTLSSRRLSNGSNVDVMGMSETPILIPEKVEPPIAETDLETEESETDEEFYDENPQRIANKLHAEKRNQLMLLASVAPSDGGSMSGDASRCTTPVKQEENELPKAEMTEEKDKSDVKEKTSSSKKKSKKKKKSKSSKKHAPIKINIPKEVIPKSEIETPQQPLVPNKIMISLQSNTVQLPELPSTPIMPSNTSTPVATSENKRASKRRRVPNKFYGYSSDEEAPSTPSLAALKPQQPPKLEWRKEDLPSPVTHKAKKEIPSTVMPQRMYNYTEPIRLTTPIVDPEPPRILMNTESSSDSDSSTEGNLEICQPRSMFNSTPIPPPTYLNSGTSSLPYPFQRPAARQAREGESVYCYCRCPYDEVSEMIACDAEGCPIEWFHFECVGIMVPPKGKWYCPECRKNQSFSGYR